MKRLFLSVAAAICVTISVRADEWPQGSGSSGAYVSSGDAAVEWSVVTGKNINWTRDLPETGQSTVVINRGKLFYTCYVPLQEDSVLGSNIVAYCADANNGEVIWERKIPGSHPLRLSGCFSDSTSPPPVTDGKRVCFFNASGTIACFDLDGKELWRREKMAVGRSQPMLVDGKVIYTRQFIMPEEGKFGHEHKNAPLELWTQLEALDIATGKSQWSTTCGVNMGAIPTLSRLSNGKSVIVLGRGGGHSPPERPLGVSAVDALNGKTLWTLPLDRFMSTQTYPVADDHALIFHGPDHLWVNQMGKIVKQVSICENVTVRRWNGSSYEDSNEDIDYRRAKGRAITQQSNLLVGDFHYFRAYTKPYLGRVHVKTGKVEYLQLPVQLLRRKESTDRMIWSLKDPDFVEADLRNNNGYVVMGDPRSRTNTWGHHASPIMTAIGDHLYLPTLLGTVYCIDWKSETLDENAILSINDLGRPGQTWTRASMSYANGKLYAHTIQKLICIEAQ